MSQRVKRVSEQIHRELGAIVQKEIEFTGGLVSIRGVEITTDFRDCMVFIGVIGTKIDEKRAIEKLEKNRRMLQSRLSKRVVLRNTPVLSFKLDDSIERGVRTLNALLEVEDLVAEDSDQNKEEEDKK